MLNCHWLQAGHVTDNRSTYSRPLSRLAVNFTAQLSIFAAA